MAQQWYYTIFLVPILLADLVIFVLFRKQLLHYKKTLLATVLFFSFPLYFLVDVLAVRVWHIWFYDTHKLLGIWLAGTAVEEFVWMILVAFMFSSLTLILKKHWWIKDAE